MSDWKIPNWGQLWEPEFEVPHLKAVAEKISFLHASIECRPDFELEGCAFCQLYRAGVNVGRLCVTRHEDGRAFFSVYLGAEEDEFHGFNTEAILSIVGNYETALPDE